MIDKKILDFMESLNKEQREELISNLAEKSEMRIEIDIVLSRIEIYKNKRLISTLDFYMCDEITLRSNASELVKLFKSFKLDSYVISI